MEEKKKTSPLLIVLMILAVICFVGGILLIKMRFVDSDKESDDTPASSLTVEDIACGEVSFKIDRDGKRKVPENSKGVGWTGGYGGMNYYLNDDNSLAYESFISVCNKWSSEDELGDCLDWNTTTTKLNDTGYKCDYIFEIEDSIIEKEDEIPVGVCLKDKKLYEIGFLESSVDSQDVSKLKPYIEEITTSCSIK